MKLAKITAIPDMFRAIRETKIAGQFFPPPASLSPAFYLPPRRVKSSSHFKELT